MVELGPQKYTQPLLNQRNSTTFKRNTLYAGKQNVKIDKLQLQEGKELNQQTGSEASTWLKSWSKGMQNKRREIKHIMGNTMKIKPDLV